MIKLLSMAEEQPEIMAALKIPGSVEILSQSMDVMMRLPSSDRTAILSFLKSFDQVSSSRSCPLVLSETAEVPNRRGMMEKVRRFLSGLPVGTKVTALSICKRAEIKPANMYQLCHSLANQGFLDRVGPAKYRICAKASTFMEEAQKIASLKPRRRMRRRKVASATAMSPRAYIESLPAKKPFRLKKVKTATKNSWNRVTACACMMAKNGLIERKSKGVYVKL